MKPSQALEAADKLVGQWPHARPVNFDTWLTSLAAALAEYPSVVAGECIDPRRGLAKKREFPPTVACLTEWCDEKMQEMHMFAAYKPIAQRLPPPDYSSEHREGMLVRLSQVVRGIFSAKARQAWIRPRGVFEKPGDMWDRAKPVQRQVTSDSWRPFTTDELRARYGIREVAE